MGFKIENRIYKRKDGRWCVAYFDTGENPKRHYIYGKTKGEVKTKLAKLEETATEAISADLPKKIQKRKAAENNSYKETMQKTSKETGIKSVQEPAAEQLDHSLNA